MTIRNILERMALASGVACRHDNGSTNSSNYFVLENRLVPFDCLGRFFGEQPD